MPTQISPSLPPPSRSMRALNRPKTFWFARAKVVAILRAVDCCPRPMSAPRRTRERLPLRTVARSVAPRLDQEGLEQTSDPARRQLVSAHLETRARRDTTNRPTVTLLLREPTERSRRIDDRQLRYIRMIAWQSYVSKSESPARAAAVSRPRIAGLRQLGAEGARAEPVRGGPGVYAAADRVTAAKRGIRSALALTSPHWARSAASGS
jgi:hypothetical protein